MRIKHTNDSLDLTNFAEKYPGLHSAAKDKRTRKALARAVALGAVVVNEYGQFTYARQNELAA